jgi:hypothetical protein
MVSTIILRLVCFYIFVFFSDNFNKDFLRGMLALLGLMTGRDMEIVSHVRGGANPRCV